MKNIIRMSDIAEKNAFDNSLLFFECAVNIWKIQLDISKKEYKTLLHGIYQIHEMHHQTYLYEKNVEKYLEITLIRCIEDQSHTITKEAIIDGIFDIETLSEDKIDSRKSILLRRSYY